MLWFDDGVKKHWGLCKINKLFFEGGLLQSVCVHIWRSHYLSYISILYFSEATVEYKSLSYFNLFFFCPFPTPPLIVFLLQKNFIRFNHIIKHNDCHAELLVRCVRVLENQRWHIWGLPWRIVADKWTIKGWRWLTQKKRQIGKQKE